MIRYLIYFLFLFTGYSAKAQNPVKNDSLLTDVALNDCIQYALKHQPLIQQSAVDEEIARSNIKIRLADWYPQINANYNLLHYFQLPTAFFPDANGEKHPAKTGVVNTSVIGLSLNQNIFNRDVLLASQSAGDVLQQARQHTVSNKIDVVVEVSKAYYDVLLTQRQVQVLDENIIRLKRSLQDAYNQYQGGIVDKIDYKRAQISLNNTQADRKRIAETIQGKMVYLKQLMGYPAENRLTIIYDSLQMEKDVATDTLQQVQLNNRIEYQLLQTEKNLLQANLKYYRWGTLPTVSAIGSYNPTFMNDRLGDLYGNVYPSSYIGVQLSIPIFQGGKRLENIHNAELQIKRNQLDLTAFTLQANTQYAQALGTYKGNLAELNSLRENMILAQDVFNTLQLQYNAGVKTYLDVIISETDLREAQLNYLNALYSALAAKLDLQKALGVIQF
ncbi:MAG: TolC family protein [Flavisolibacter sp.]